jgi:hypothetical protein
MATHPTAPPPQSSFTAADLEEWRRRMFPRWLEPWSGDEHITLEIDTGGHSHGEYGLVSFDLCERADRAGLAAVAERVFERGVLRYDTGGEPEFAKVRVVYGDYAPHYVALIEDDKYNWQQEGLKRLRERLSAERRDEVGR